MHCSDLFRKAANSSESQAQIRENRKKLHFYKLRAMTGSLIMGSWAVGVSGCEVVTALGRERPHFPAGSWWGFWVLHEEEPWRRP